jgi:hypothetical protein
MSEIIIGCALSDVNRADLPRGLRVPEQLAEYARRSQQRIGSPQISFQFQPEDPWTLPATFPDQFVPRKTNRWFRAFQTQPSLLEAVRAASDSIGVHQPIQKRDALSSNFFTKYEAIEETKTAMDFAQHIGADYFVFHLAQVDKWAWDRRDQMDKALKIFNVFATYYTAQKMTFIPVIETLEYPKFPATGGEAFDLLNECRKSLRATKLALDVTHLWSSRKRMLELGAWPDERVTFEAALEYALESLVDDVHVFHLGGGWESETHAVPGLHPQEDPFRFPMKLRESHSVYEESGELDLNRALELLVNYTGRRGRDLHLVLQIFDRDFEQVLEAARLIRHDLIARLNQPPAASEAELIRRESKRSSQARGKGKGQTRSVRAGNGARATRGRTSRASTAARGRATSNGRRKTTRRTRR